MWRIFSKNKLHGIIGILIGLLCFCSFLIGDNNKLIIQTTDFLLIKYFIVITIANGGILFIIFGILTCMSIVVPYYSEGITKYEKAKNNLLSVIITIPFWFSFFITIFNMSSTFLWKILGGLALIYMVWLTYSSINILKNR